MKDVNIEFSHKGLVLITGENGCGKSTLLNIIGGLDNASAGKVIYGDANENAGLKERAENTSYIFQTANLISTLTVRQNVEVVRAENSPSVDEALQLVGIADLGERKTYELSVGQQQRVCIARAIVKNDSVLLADEPTSSLDPDMRKEIANMLTMLAKDRLVIVVTHYPEDFENPDRHIVIDRGKIVSDTQSRETFLLQKNGKGKPKSKAKILMNSTLYRARKHFIRFSVNMVMLAVLFVCLAMYSVLNVVWNDEQTIYNRQILSNDQILVKTDDYSTLGSDIKKRTLFYKWVDFPEGFSNDFTPDFDAIESDYYSVYMYYDPYFVDVSELKGKKLLMGRMPEKENEVVINKYLADVYVKYYEKEKLTSYEDVLNKAVLTLRKYGVPVQQDPVFDIVGITDDDLSEFEELKSSKTPYRDINYTHFVDQLPSDAFIHYYELSEKLRIHCGGIYAINAGYSNGAVNGYYNSEINWTTEKRNMYAQQGSGIINYDFDKTLLSDVQIYGDTSGAIVSFDSISTMKYKDFCEKYPLQEDRDKEIQYLLSQYKGKELYFSFEYMEAKKSDGILGMLDRFKRTYYFDVTVPITGIYIPDDSYYLDEGSFNQGGDADIRNTVLLVGGEYYAKLNEAYNTPPEYGYALISTSELNSVEDVNEKLIHNRHISEIVYEGKTSIENSISYIRNILKVALYTGVSVLAVCVIFLVYSITQYFRQYSGDAGILMSIGKSKLYCCMYLLGEFLFMALISAILIIPIGIIVPVSLNNTIAGVSTAIEVFSVSAMPYVIMYGFLLGAVAIAIAATVIAIYKKTPIERIRDRS